MDSGEIFGSLPGGEAVRRVILRGGGLTASVLDHGATLQDLRLDGHAPPLVLGFSRLEDYLAHSAYFGATVGRCANRIAGASFTIDGTSHQLDRNFRGRHHLHGGRTGTDKRLWSFDEVGPASATLRLTLEDGEMGYPGALSIAVRFALEPGGALDIRMTATTDRPTICNLVHHSYFNLSGGGDILGHSLRVTADHYLPVDADLIPTGQVSPVAETPFDLRTDRSLAGVCAATRLDHNFCLANARVPVRPVAELSAGDIAMTVRTTEPGLQVFDGAPLSCPVPGLDGRAMGAYAGIALEPQGWPDAIHHEGWPGVLLRPGETYRQQSQFVFSRRAH